VNVISQEMYSYVFDMEFRVSIPLVKCKAIPLKAWTDPEDSRSLRLPDFKTIGA
jgi:hypothetical protein